MRASASGPSGVLQSRRSTRPAYGVAANGNGHADTRHQDSVGHIVASEEGGDQLGVGRHVGAGPLLHAKTDGVG
jgi:hypothetical protein